MRISGWSSDVCSSDRLELGRTMMTDARLVLLDEPAAGVNRTLLREVEEKIRRLNEERGFTFLLVEHDMAFIEKLCDPVICMSEGRVLVEGAFATVRRNPQVLEPYLGESVACAGIARGPWRGRSGSEGEI